MKCIETGEIFKSARQAAETKGWGSSSVSRVCNGTKKSIYGTHWVYLDDIDENNIEELDNGIN